MVYIHATFLLLLGWVALSHFLDGHGPEEAIRGILFILLVFACVVMHEYGHALTARRFGIRTRDITLLPIGGVARLERLPRDPAQELVVALAGPLVNAMIAAVLYAVALYLEVAASMTSVRLVGGDLLSKLLWVNVALVVFNMLPAFPMDGGRVLRAMLAERMEYARATRTAANVGQGMAFLFGFLGLFLNPFLIFVALFVYLGAEAEAQRVKYQSAVRGLPVRQAMQTRFVTLAPEDSLGHAMEVLLAGSQQDFPVVTNGHVVGLLTRRDLLSALQQRGPTASVQGAMHMQITPASPGA